MQWLADVCVRRPVFALVLVLAMFVAGVAAYQGLRVDRLPQMDLPTLTLFTSYPGASAQEIETEITQVLEDAVATVSGIDELRSLSRDGNSLLIITFNLNRDIDAAAQDVRDAVAGSLWRLPRDVDPPIVIKQDLDASPILTLVVSGNRHPRELYVLADRYVKNVIESAQGIGRVFIAGAADRAVQANIEARRLAAYQLSITQVRDALARQNTNLPGGQVDAGVRELNLRTLGRFEAPDRFRELVVATSNGAPVRLRDLGEVVDGSKEVRSLARLNGQPAVAVIIRRQSGTNTMDVIRAVKERLPRCRELLPPGVEISVVQDQSHYIEAAMHEIQGHLVVGSVLATVVVLVFMGSWRSTLIAAVAIPGSIVATFAAMRLLGFTLNNVTMLALVLMVGIVIDDAIVVLENVYRFIEEKGMSPRAAAIEGTREIGLAVLATTLSLVIVFLPVSFLSSVTGRMLYEFGMTSVVAILISLVISFSLTPMMCSQLLQNAGAASRRPSRRPFYQRLEQAYDSSLRFALRRRGLVCGLIVAVVVANVPLYRIVKQDYLPTNVDESNFEVGVTAQEGASLVAMDATMQAVEAEIRQVPGVNLMLSWVGSMESSAVNTGEIHVELSDVSQRTFSASRLLRATLRGKPWTAWQGNYSQSAVMQQIRDRLSRFKELTIAVRNRSTLRQGAPVDMDFIIEGPDINVLADLSERLRQKISGLPGIVDTWTTLRMDKPELRVDINRERAAALGVDAQEIAQTLRFAVGGDDRVTRYHDPEADDTYDVELRLVALDRGSRDSIGQLYVRANPRPWNKSADDSLSRLSTDSAAAQLTRLDNVVDFQYGESPPRIDRVNRQRMAAVRANLGPGFALADRLDAIRAAAVEMGMPPGYTTRVSGRGRELERTIQDFGWTFLLSFIFMYLVLAAQFEHLVHPLTILISLPLAVPFGLISLLLGGETLNLYSALGILVLFGVVKKNSILQIDHTNQLRAAGLDRTTAILQANRDRLRPILMTTIAFVAGMIPLLLGAGPGAEERRSIAVLAAGGQTLSLVLTLLAAPVVYSLFDDLSQAATRWWRRSSTPGDMPAEAGSSL